MLSVGIDQVVRSLMQELMYDEWEICKCAYAVGKTEVRVSIYIGWHMDELVHDRYYHASCLPMMDCYIHVKDYYNQ